jgi:outer membrane protein OmpA-like peptidoglycan-associated protein
MMLLWRAGTPTIRFLGVLAVVGTAGWWLSFVAPAMAQNAGVSPPEVSVDLDVLNSLDHGPTPSDGGITLHPPRERDDVAAEREPGRVASSRPGRRARATAGTPAVTSSASTRSDDDAGRGAGGEALDESHRKSGGSARLKREEAERLRQAKAEIEQAARRASPPQKVATTAGGIPSPGPGPVAPPPPNPSKPGGPPGPVASTTHPAALAPSPPAAPAEPKRAALVKSTLPTPHIDFAVGTADLSPAARSALDAIAKTLARDDGTRVQLVAYATGTADEANQARRISLSRALNVRAYLIDHGVRNTRMDVRALGNRPDGNKPADRVEIVLLDK